MDQCDTDIDGVCGVKSDEPRQLSEEEKKKTDDDSCLVSDFKQNKLEVEAKKNWDLFYKRNSTKFFKDRHWTTREFEELETLSDDVNEFVLLEAGCGVGNAIFPLLKKHANIFIYACDFSPRALQFIENNEMYSKSRCRVFQCDLTVAGVLSSEVKADSRMVDVVTLLFVLSAVHPDKMSHVITNIVSVLKPGGCVLFRDYAVNDHAMVRFSPSNKLSSRFYVRQDGTRAYYFEKSELQTMFERAGMHTERLCYIHKQTVNKKQCLSVPRIFLQSKFYKPVL